MLEVMINNLSSKVTDHAHATTMVPIKHTKLKKEKLYFVCIDAFKAFDRDLLADDMKCNS